MKPLFLIVTSALLVIVAPGGEAAELPKTAGAFIDSHCIDCHDADTARAGFRIDLLTRISRPATMPASGKR